MPRKQLKYVNTYVDRTGTLRSYFRKSGEPRVEKANAERT